MNVSAFLDNQKCWYEHVAHRPTSGAQRVAGQLHVPGHEVAKTVLLRVQPKREYVLAVLPADMTIDMKRAKALLAARRLELATELEIATFCTDCEFGALPPFGSRYGLKTIVDASLAQDETILFEGNTHHDAYRMRFDDFRRLENPEMASFAVPESDD
ncbi:MAG: aminoacyl-tRNA deacylase [Pirellulales bacterium]